LLPSLRLPPVNLLVKPRFFTGIITASRFIRRPRETDPMAPQKFCTQWGIAEACSQFRADWLIGALIVSLQITDILSTEKILLAGGAETNPVVWTLIHIFGPAWWVPKLVLAAFVAGYFGTRKLSWSAIVAVALCAIVVTHNVLQPV
jgi:hypothetical protein